MPSYVRLRGEKSLVDIITRVYRGGKPADVERAREALLKANPHLKQLEKMRPGTMIVVPELAGLTRTDPKTDARTEGGRADPARPNAGKKGAGPKGVPTLSELAEDVRKSLADSVERARVSVTKQEALLADPEIAPVIEENKLGERVTQVRERLRAKVEQARQRQARVTRAFDRMRKKVATHFPDE